MRQYRTRFRPAPWRAEEVRRHDAADRKAELDVRDVHEHEREQKVGRGKAYIAEEGKAMVTPAVLMRGGVDADWECDGPREEHDREIQDEGQHEAIAHHVLHGHVVLEGPAEIAL